MKRNWLGFGLVMIGSIILGYVFSEVEFMMGLLGLVGYGIALVGMALLGSMKDE